MRITKELLRKLITEEIREGIEEIDDEVIVTAGDGDASPEARAGARLEDVLLFLEEADRLASLLDPNNREATQLPSMDEIYKFLQRAQTLTEPLRKVQELIDALR